MVYVLKYTVFSLNPTQSTEQHSEFDSYLESLYLPGTR